MCTGSCYINVLLYIYFQLLRYGIGLYTGSDSAIDILLYIYIYFQLLRHGVGLCTGSCYINVLLYIYFQLLRYGIGLYTGSDSAIDILLYIYIYFQLLRHGVGLSTGSDSELITQLLTHMPECGEPDGVNWVGRSVLFK